MPPDPIDPATRRATPAVGPILRHPLANGWVLLGWALAALLLQIALAMGVYGTGEEGLRVCARGTLRIGFVLFVAAISASSLLHFTRGEFAKWLLRNRRQLGFSFGCAHFFHIGFIVLLERNGFVSADRSIFTEPGVIIYVFIGLMMLTSFDATTQPLPRWLWVGLHKWGVYSIWFAFAGAFVGRVVEGQLFYVPFVGSLAAAMGLRWWVGISRLRTKRAAIPAVG